MSQTPLSATIRLHQVKYSAKTGIPPVNRGLLMVYNMGNLKDPSAVNSILDVEELKKYITNLHGYPLPLDVALPLFSWTVLFRDNSFKGLFNDLTREDLSGPSIHQITDNRFEILRDTSIKGYELRARDVLRVEESKYDQIISAVNTISALLPSDALRVSLFHLDSLILRKYTSHDLESIYNSLH